MDKKRSSFSGRIGFVLAAAGSAVGLGNIWRFPYLSVNTGGMFLLVYLILVATFGYTIIMSETTIGRMIRKAPLVPSAFSVMRNGASSVAGSMPLYQC